VDQAFVTLPFPGGDHWISGLAALIEDIQARDARGHKVIVFFPTTNMCIFFSHVFNKVYRIPALEIHSKKSQSARTRTSARFRQGRRGVLFTTDVSARGVDYPNVTHVIQYGSAEHRETYIHRLGRTGRAGKKGQGLVIVGSPEEEQKLGEVLWGLDVKRDDRSQRVLEGEGEDYDDAGRLARVHDAVASRGSDLERQASHAYRSLLGYHGSHLDNLGMTKQQMVHHVNDLARQMGYPEGAQPSLSPKVVQALNLRGIRGVNVSPGGHDRGGFGGGNGGGYGGGGGGSNYRHGDARGRGGPGSARGGDRGSRGNRGSDGGYGGGRGRGGGYSGGHDDEDAWSGGSDRGGRGYGRGGGQGGGQRRSNSRPSFNQRWEID